LYWNPEKGSLPDKFRITKTKQRENPNTKYQIPNNKEIPNYNDLSSYLFVIYHFEFVWYLEFGAWNLF